MSGNYYSEINLHVVWHTKRSLPLLSPQIEPAVHRFLRQRLVQTPGVYVHETGGIENHVHLAVSIPPTVTISDLVGQLKGASSHHINHENATKDKLLQWQTGYGVVSFGTKDLQWVAKYVRNQREHHARGRVHGRLERMTNNEAPAEHIYREGL